MKDRDPLLMLAMAMVLYSWVIIPMGIGIFKGVRKDMRDARERGEPVLSVFTGYARVSVFLVIMGILILIALVLAVGVGSFAWDILFGSSYEPDFDEYAV